MNRMRIKTSVVLLILCCAPGWVMQSGRELCAQDKIAPQDESFDPTILKEPPLPMLDNTLIYEVVTDLKTPAAKVSTPDDSVQYVEKMGWKVQVFSTSDFFLADSIYREAVLKFGNEEVEKVFNLPYYKIRIGNCLTREDAERFLTRAQAIKYPDAWVIRTQIKVRVKADIY